jgi:long-chain acyl-CoA synthetase
VLKYASAARYVVPADANVADDVFENARTRPEHVAFSRKLGTAWLPVTSRQFAIEVTELAAGLIAAGIESGDRVALMSKTSYQWALCDYAIWTAGAVTVPIYETSSAEQVEWYLSDSGAKAVFVATAEHRSVVASVLSRLHHELAIWQLDAGVLDELSDSGPGVAEQVERRRRAVGAASLATIVYTSGTTGRPKGCAMTHENLLAESGNVLLADGVQESLFNATKSTLLFLPLAHILARIIQISAVRSGVRLGHVGDVKNLVAELREFAPTVVLSVPRVFEKLYNTASHQAAEDGHERIFRAAEETAIVYSRALESGSPGFTLRLRRTVFDRLVYRKLRAAMGGRVEFAVSGGAPLGARLGHFFRGAGVNVLEGYGLTETCAGGTLNLPGAQRVGSVGRPVPGCAIRVELDGEILIEAPFVFQGYWHDDAATAEVLADGWFRTGDLGALDGEGFVSITGRKKDLIVTSGGKNVAPTVLEDRLRAHWLVSQCLVIGDARPYIAALVTIDPESFELWKGDHDRSPDCSIGDLRDDTELRAAVQEAVDETNRAVSHAEAIKRFRILATDFTETAGELTPTMKVRRSVVIEQFADEVDSLYAYSSTPPADVPS